MGEVRKIGDEYFVEFFARGLKYQQRAGKDLAAAEKLLQNIESQIAAGELKTIERYIDLDLFLSDFLKNAQTKFSPVSLQRFEALAAHFFDFMRKKFPTKKRLSDVTPIVIEEYKRTLLQLSVKKHKSELVNLSLFLLREVCEYGIKIDFLNDNPTLHIPFEPQKQKRKLVYLSALQKKLLLEKLSLNFKNIFLLVLATGLRASELQEPFVFEDGKLKVEGRWARSIPADYSVREILPQIQGKIDVRKMLQDMSGILNQTVTFQTLRHTFVRDLVEKNVSLSIIFRLLGETDLAKILIYLPWIPRIRPDMY